MSAEGLATAVDLRRVVATASSFATTEYASLTRDGRPVTWPVTPYRGADGATLDVATGLTYPLKAERARRDPRVALSFTHPVGSGLEQPPHLVVLGAATVRDADLLGNSARYLRVSRERFPEAFGRIPPPLLKRLAWYWTRIWVEVTPLRALWWEGGDLSRPPIEWRAAPGTVAPPSDPAPAGRSSGSWTSAAPDDWRRRVGDAIGRLGLPVLTARDAEGWPLPVPVRAARRVDDGYVLEAPAGVPLVGGPAFLSFHAHAEEFEAQENVGLAGTATVDGTEVHVRVDRAAADWSLPAGKLRGTVRMLQAGRRLTPRLRAEAERRGQPVPRYDQL